VSPAIEGRFPVLPHAERFGAQVRGLWAIEPESIYLNHGTVGAPPRRVLEAQQAIRDQIERHPSRFLLRELSSVIVGARARPVPRLREAAAEVAAFVGAEPEDLVFVDNATSGANAVLRSLPLERGDELVIGDHAYGAVALTARYVARERGATVRVVELPWPPDPAAVAAAFEAALSPRTRLAIVDHVTSESALVLPLAEVAARCRARGVPVLADGAHAPGALPLDLPALGVDWYAANLHKWAWAPRSCGFLWARRERQKGLHPAVISWGLDQGFTHEFDWVGTRDPSPWLAAPAAIAYLRELGEKEVRAYDHALAWEGARWLAARWQTEFPTPETMIGTMATLPLPARLGATREAADRVRDALLSEERIEVQIHAGRERLWVRISGQIYNDFNDIERLAEAVSRQPADVRAGP
jgi:isopenicillin-N epimerase